MSTLDWIVWGIAAAFCIPGLRGLARLWRHEATAWDRRPGWWPYGERSFHAWRLAMPSLVLAFVGMVLAVGLLYLPPYPKFGVPQALGAVALVATLALAALALSTALTGRPRRLVFPWLREGPAERSRPAATI
jgi:hypothetical protein